MKTKNKPVFIPCFRWLIENSPAQRYSIMSNLGMGVMRVMERRHTIKHALAQRDSGNSKLDMGLIGLLGPIGLMGEKPAMENRSAQPDSGIFNFGFGKHCHRRGRRGAILTIKVKNISRCFMGRWGNWPMSKMQNSPAQRYSKMSILKIETKNSLPQRYSKMSIWDFIVNCHTRCSKNGILTIKIKNITDCFIGRWVDESMGQKQNGPAQRDSGKSKLAEENMGVIGEMGVMDQNYKIKNSLPQRYSKMSNFGWQPGLFCLWQGRGNTPFEKNVPAQRYSKMSNERLLGVSCLPRGQKIVWQVIGKVDVFHINLFQRVEKYKFSVKFYLDILIQKLIFIKIRQ